MLNWQTPPADIVAAAEKDYAWIRGELDAAPIVRTLLAGRLTEVETLTDLRTTLRWQ